MQPTLRQLRGVVIASALGVASLHHLVSCSSAAKATAASSPKSASPRTSEPGALEKTVLGLDVPPTRSEFSISADGKRSYFAYGSAYYVFDETGNMVRRMPTKGNTRTLAPLQDGRFFSAQSGGRGHVALLGSDGAELSSIVGQGASPQKLRHDTTGWTSPFGLAFDPIHQLLFVLDTTAARTGVADPDWSRIAVFDANGKYLREVATYDGVKMPSTSEYRTWYDDIEIDAKRSRLYVTARASKELWALDYNGAWQARSPGINGIAVFPNGNVAVGDPDKHHVRIYDGALHLVKTLTADATLDLEADPSGRLYASIADQTVLYLRWPATLSEPEAVRPRYQHISVGLPFDSVATGSPFAISVAASGNPALGSAAWHVFARPSDGTDLDWRELNATVANGKLNVKPPLDLLGFNDIAVRYGNGSIARADPARDLHVEKTIRFESGVESGGVRIWSLAGRSGFRRGESIAFQVDRQGPGPGATTTLSLVRDGEALATAALSTTSASRWELPPAVTRRLMPGHYALRSSVTSTSDYPFEFDLAEAEADSSLQRILYHEFDQNPATAQQAKLPSVAERLAFIRDYLNSAMDLHFTRETDRSALKLSSNKYSGAWRDDNGPSSAHDIVPLGGAWEPEFYLDRATAKGINYDTQLLAHCSGVRLADAWFPPLNATLQRLAQWFGKYPSFYGFNYNDEAFFNNIPFTDSLPADGAWLDAEASRLSGRPKPDIYRAGLTRMYGEFDRALAEIRPDLGRTATPMWQYPAVDGSYAPTVYAHMTESYSHYLGEGYGWPWYAPHSAEMLRRPGLPLMGVFDNNLNSGDGEFYLKNALQVIGRGVQGVGVEHARPLKDASASNAFRLMNSLAQAYGSIFAETEPDNEAAVLYSYSQDVTEKRDLLGTPHWERVLALHGAGLMAGLPMSVVYEEDIAAGWLLDHSKPRVKLLFLAGQMTELPTQVKSALRRFVAAGGRVVIDADSRDFPGAVRFQQGLLGPIDAAREALDSDALFPDTQPAYEALAHALQRQFSDSRRFAVDTDDPWTSKNRFAAGAIHYVLIAAETGPYNVDAATVWGLGAHYNRAYPPKQVQLSIPHTPVVYDVFNRQTVRATATADGKGDLIQADLSAFPGKLYALAPRVLKPPKLRARVSRDSIAYAIDVGMDARVPLSIVLSNGRGWMSTFYRLTNIRGEFEHTATRPIGSGPWQLKVSELLGGTSSTLSIPASEILQPWVNPLPSVETEREPEIVKLLSQSRRDLRVVGAIDDLSSALRTSLLQSLKARGMRVSIESAPPAVPAPGTYLILTTLTAKNPGQLVQQANQTGLFGRRLSSTYPGEGRGFISAAFAPRVYEENCILVAGGDQKGLQVATERFIALLNKPNTGSRADGDHSGAPTVTLVASPAGDVDIPRVNEVVGTRLSGIRAVKGRLAVSATGYLKNVVRVDDKGDHGEVVAVTRAGDSPATTSLFLSSDGTSYGVAARTIQRFGEAFSLSSTTSATTDAFTSFGDAAPFQHAFSVSADATTVVAPGPYGVVAWHHGPGGWLEAWSVDYWKRFDQLDWPVAADASRIPSFDTLVPQRGNVALVTFTEVTNNGWVQNQASSSAEVTARALNDGAIRWHFAPPIFNTLVFPRLYANSDGSLVVLQAQLGTWGRETFRYYTLNEGTSVGSWSSDDAPLSFDVSDRTRRIATVYGGGSRLLEVREADGTIAFSKTWHAQPLTVSFAADGRSVFLTDDAGVLTRLDARGTLVWQVHLGCSGELARDGGNLYVAGWDGRVRAFTEDGLERWKLDLTDSMTKESSPGTIVVHEPNRPRTTSSEVPRGVNLLRSGAATISVGGTRGWKSKGTVEIQASTLTNGILDDAAAPWLSQDELYWDGTTSRKAWAEVSFNAPTTVHSLTVYENPNFPGSWPTEGLVQVWDPTQDRWRTVKHGVFLDGPVATYAVDLKQVTKLRYVPWSNYFHNFHTSEIEVR